jgi:hypothetical protein
MRLSAIMPQKSSVRDRNDPGRAVFRERGRKIWKSRNDDERDCGIAARMLGMLNCTRIVLLTSNPANHRYMIAEAVRSGHRFDRLTALLANPSWATTAARTAASTEPREVQARTGCGNGRSRSRAAFVPPANPARQEETSEACRGPPSAPAPTCCAPW